MLRTKNDIEYKTFMGPTFIIPAGTRVIPADNLPIGSHILYWAENWHGMNEEAKGIMRNQGFGLSAVDVLGSSTLSPVQQAMLHKQCPACHEDELTALDSVGSDEPFLWCSSCDATVDAIGRNK